MFGKDIGKTVIRVAKIYTGLGLVTGLFIIVYYVLAFFVNQAKASNLNYFGANFDWKPVISAVGIMLASYFIGLIIAAFGEHVRCQTALVDAAEEKQTIVIHEKEKVVQPPQQVNAVPSPRFTASEPQAPVYTPPAPDITPQNTPEHNTVTLNDKPEPLSESAPAPVTDQHPTVTLEDKPKVDFSRRNVAPTSVMEHENQVMKQENETLLKQIKVLEAEKEELIQRLAEKNN